VDTLTSAHSLGLYASAATEHSLSAASASSAAAAPAAFTKDDYSLVSRFESTSHFATVMYVCLCLSVASHSQRVSLITSAEEGGYVFSSVCLSVCLFVCLSVGLLANL